MNGNLTLNKPFISNYIDISASIFENQFLGSVFGYQGFVCKNGFYVKSGPETSGVTTYALIDSIGTISTTSTIDAVGLITSDTGFNIPRMSPLLTIDNNGTITQTSIGLNNLFNSSFSGTSNQIEIKNTSNVGPSTISQSGSSLNISSVSNNVSPQTSMVLSTRNATNGGCVLFNGNSTILNIGTNTATTNITSTSIANIQSPTLNITSTTSNINSTNMNINAISSFKNNVNISLYNFDITNTLENQGMRIFNNGSNNGITDFHGIGSSTRFNFYSTPGIGLEVNNLWIGNGNNAVIQGQAGKGIEITNDNIVIQGITNFNNTTTPTITNTISLTDNTQKIATTAFVKGQSYATTTNLNNYALLTTPSQTFTGTNILSNSGTVVPLVIKTNTSGVGNTTGNHFIAANNSNYNPVTQAGDYVIFAGDSSGSNASARLALTTYSINKVGIIIDDIDITLYGGTISQCAPFNCGYYQLPVPFTTKVGYDIGYIFTINGLNFTGTAWTSTATNVAYNIMTIDWNGFGNYTYGIWQCEIAIIVDAVTFSSITMSWTSAGPTSSSLSAYTDNTNTGFYNLGTTARQILRLNFVLSVTNLTTSYYLNFWHSGGNITPNVSPSYIRFTRIA